MDDACSATVLHRARACITAYRKARHPGGLPVARDPRELSVRSENVIGKFRASGLGIFDPYLSTGFDLRETRLTKVLSYLFDPVARHGLGSLLLCSLVRAAAPAVPNLAASILRAIEEAPSPKIRCNHSHSTGLIDIVISGKGYIIAIENKMRGGAETVTSGGVQTERYDTIVDELAAARKLAADQQLRIFLSPEGKNPSSSRFVALRSGDLAREMLSSLRIAPPEVSEDQLALVRAFLLTYSRIS